MSLRIGQAVMWRDPRTGEEYTGKVTQQWPSHGTKEPQYWVEGPHLNWYLPASELRAVLGGTVHDEPDPDRMREDRDERQRLEKEDGYNGE